MKRRLGPLPKVEISMQKIGCHSKGICIVVGCTYIIAREVINGRVWTVHGFTESHSFPFYILKIPPPPRLSKTGGGF